MGQNGDDYANLEAMGRDLARKIAGDDFDQLSAALGDGAAKLSSAIRNYMRQ